MQLPPAPSRVQSQRLRPASALQRCSSRQKQAGARQAQGSLQWSSRPQTIHPNCSPLWCAIRLRPSTKTRGRRSAGAPLTCVAPRPPSAQGSHPLGARQYCRQGMHRSASMSSRGKGAADSASRATHRASSLCHGGGLLPTASRLSKALSRRLSPATYNQ